MNVRCVRAIPLLVLPIVAEVGDIPLLVLPSCRTGQRSYLSIPALLLSPWAGQPHASQPTVPTPSEFNDLSTNLPDREGTRPWFVSLQNTTTKKALTAKISNAVGTYKDACVEVSLVLTKVSVTSAP